ncbi:FAS1-like dehydratase domain-containing protein [Nakamurella leprariae]|uniref:MaoC family dehydratase N-terminal domain-containing protein n=1 Tax=Nakamurella leprariae TaxID=2803911 RepID=A0A939C0J9_9ACTN|nr:MaoC family dehydratase N-terminal domain-containing protein [Nakamurella leprariae]MBM9466227.1 MaoC family dehydratase N-terminal domain-containing protein [Nakamurella leprariae]
MSLNQSMLGHTWPATTYTVGGEKVAEFLEAIGAGRPTDPATAAVPPTFAVAVVAGAQESVFFDADLGLDFSRVVHRDQRFDHHRPMRVGDRLRCEPTVTGIQQLAGNDVLTVTTEVRDAAGHPVCTAVTGLVARAAS